MRNIFYKFLFLSFSLAMVTSCNDDEVALNENKEELKIEESEKENRSSFKLKDFFDSTSLTRYIGTEKVQPLAPEKLLTGAENYSFPKGEKCPACITGNDFNVQVWDKPSSKKLVVYLQGGGVCGEDVCFATNFPEIVNDYLMDILKLTGNVFSDGNVMADYDLMNVPYCDGSLFLGDKDRLNDDFIGFPQEITQRGLINITAVFTLAKQKFPDAEEIIITGSSAGSFGSIGSIYIGKQFFPDVPFKVLLDSGVGVLRDGNVSFFESIVRSIGAEELVGMPGSESGNVVDTLSEFLNSYPDISIALLSTTRDAVISSFVGIPANETDTFQNAMTRELEEFAKKNPERGKVFLIDGDDHTFFMTGSPMVTNLTELLRFVFPVIDSIRGITNNLGILSTLLNAVDIFNFSDYIMGNSTINVFGLGNSKQSGKNEDGAQTTVEEFVRQFLNDPSNTKNVFDY